MMCYPALISFGSLGPEKRGGVERGKGGRAGGAAKASKGHGHLGEEPSRMWEQHMQRHCGPSKNSGFYSSDRRNHWGGGRGDLN